MKTRTNQPVVEYEDDIREVATELIEDGEVENAKPIYIHPIYLTGTANGEDIQTTCLIFNNDATPFTATTLYEFIKALYDEVGEQISIMASGGKTVGNDTAPLVRITYNVAGLYFTAKGLSSQLWSKSNFESMTMTDGVNKIN